MKDLYLKKKEALEKELENIETMKISIIAKIELLNELITDFEKSGTPTNDAVPSDINPYILKTL